MQRIGVVAVIAVCIVLLSGCVTTANDNMNSTLWLQSSSEYMASSLQTYNVARGNTDLALHDKNWTAAPEQTGDFSSLPVAVVMDVDETVLDNSKYQAKLVKTGTAWSSDTWDAWLALDSAPAVPGAVDFIHFLKKKQIRVFYITNRTCRPRKQTDAKCPQEKDMIDNLARVGIAGVKPENILLKNEQPDWTSEKKTRLELIAAHHRILMLFGDNLGDFLPGVKKNITPARRHALVLQYKNNWGRKWYVLSNPIYGSWLNVLGEPKSSYLVGY